MESTETPFMTELLSVSIYEAWRLLKQKDILRRDWLFGKQTMYRLNPWSSRAEKGLMRAWNLWEKKGLHPQQSASESLQAWCNLLDQQSTLFESHWELRRFLHISEDLTQQLRKILHGWIPWVPPYWIATSWFDGSEAILLEGWTPWLWIQNTALSQGMLPENPVFHLIRPETYGALNQKEKRFQWQALSHCLKTQFPVWNTYVYHRLDFQEKQWIYTVISS